jgi:hypothetical protein
VDMVSTGAEYVIGRARWYANCVLTDADAATMADVLLALAEDRGLISRMGLAGRGHASLYYRAETLVGNVDTLYRELMKGKSVGGNS